MYWDRLESDGYEYIEEEAEGRSARAIILK
jgi:hypothetical protein